MTNDDIIKSIAENEQRSRSNSRRIEELEKNAVLLNKIVTAMEVLASQQKNVAERLEKIDGKVTKIEQAPMKKIYALIGYVLAAFCSAAVGAFFGIKW